MSFISITFLLFFAITVFLYFLIPWKYRWILLLISSYCFYAFSSLEYLLILLMSTLITFISGYMIDKSEKHKKIIFVVSFILNLSILVVFKYTNFIAINIQTILQSIGINYHIGEFDIILPLGLSFYIFQSTTYLGDIYRKKVKVEKNIFRYALFVSYFPCILSGPIQKSRDLLPQLYKKVEFDYERVKKGLLLICYGFFVKLVLANRLLAVVNNIFDDYTKFNSVFYIIAAICFSFQIYCDFASYSDIAIGVSKVFGIEFNKNFNRPYLSTSIADFWKNWHISLNSWFVEYVFIPLGGSRVSKLKKYRNILAVFLFSGIWHGASWHFVVWGLANGLLQVFGDITRQGKSKLYKFFRIDEEAISVRVIKTLVTFILITITWVFFRIPSVRTSIYIIGSCFTFNPILLFNENLLAFAGSFSSTIYLILMLILFLTIQCLRGKQTAYETFMRQPTIIRNIIYIAFVIIVAITWMSSSAEINKSFIYFQF